MARESLSLTSNQNVMNYMLDRMKLVAILAITFLTSAKPSIAQAFSPPLPPSNSFTDCMLDPSPHPEFKRIESCLQANWKTFSDSPPVDGNQNIRHMAWKLWRFSNENGTVYQLQQYAYNCKTGFMIERTARSYIDPNQANSPLNLDGPGEWSDTTSKPHGHRRYCLF